MKAMILAAGRGERLRPLTDHIPKPLLAVRGKALIVWHLEALARAGVREVIINLAWLGAQIRAALGGGERCGLAVHYSQEPEGALESGGGIYQALPLLGAEPFIVVNSDTYTDFDYADLEIAARSLAHLVLVPNPVQHPHGDFSLLHGDVLEEGAARFTYSGIGIYRPEFFADCTSGRFPLLPWLRRASAARRLQGEVFRGRWEDVGTPGRLAALNDAPA